MTSEAGVDFWVGDTAAVVARLEAGSVDLVCTSPPFWQLRSYLPADAPEKPFEHGSEPTPAAFLAGLLDQVELWGTKLAVHGSICVELGDTRSGSGGAGGDYRADGLREGQPRFQGSARAARDAGGRAFPRAKSLCLVPQAFALSLAYGRNVLALPGQPEWREFVPWIVRNVVRWTRSNPPVGALSDRWRDATSEICVATRSPSRWWDDLATRRPLSPNTHTRVAAGTERTDLRSRRRDGNWATLPERNSDPAAGAPLLDWWLVNPTGFRSAVGEHFASWPPDLCVPLIEAMCPRRVCTLCGTPSRRLLSEARYVGKDGQPAKTLHVAEGSRRAKKVNQWGATGADQSCAAVRETVGWSSCDCGGADGLHPDGWHTGPAWRPGCTLDPYAGTGATLAVAHGHSRAAVGVDLNPANAALVQERLGMFARIHPADEAA